MTRPRIHFFQARAIALLCLLVNRDLAPELPPVEPHEPKRKRGPRSGAREEARRRQQADRAAAKRGSS